MENTKIDISIAKANIKLQPIISHLRNLIHKVYPEIEENIKWNYPSFEIEGKIIITIMIFKNHINFVFYNGISLLDQQNLLIKFGEKTNMKGLKHVKKMADLPEDIILTNFIKEAVL